jgi:hypothetical protein
MEAALAVIQRALALALPDSMAAAAAAIIKLRASEAEGEVAQEAMLTLELDSVDSEEGAEAEATAQKGLEEMVDSAAAAGPGASIMQAMVVSVEAAGLANQPQQTEEPVDSEPAVEHVLSAEPLEKGALEEAIVTLVLT